MEKSLGAKVVYRALAGILVSSLKPRIRIAQALGILPQYDYEADIRTYGESRGWPAKYCEKYWHDVVVPKMNAARDEPLRKSECVTRLKGVPIKPPRGHKHLSIGEKKELIEKIYAAGGDLEKIRKRRNFHIKFAFAKAFGKKITGVLIRGAEERMEDALIYPIKTIN